MSDGTNGPVPVTGVPAKPNADGIKTLLTSPIFETMIQVEAGSLPVYRALEDLKTNFPEQWCLYILDSDNFSRLLKANLCHTIKLLQELYKHVQRSGQEFATAQAKSRWKGDKKDWIVAAKDFRMPFWDWADPEKDVIPADTLPKLFNVWTPDTSHLKVDVENPLYAYKFANTTEDGTMNVKFSVHLPKQIRFKDTNLTERVCYILQAYERYGPFSHDAFSAGHPEIYGSMDDIHNSIHNSTGGGGHMAGITVSAFDPIFWLHHTNIDRLFSIWQALHGSSSEEPYVVSSPALRPNWTSAAAEVETTETPLQPFNETSEKDKYWKASGVKETSTFGYYYPETEQWKFAGNPADFRKDVTDKINALYPAGSLASAIQAKLDGRTTSLKLLRSCAEVVPAAQGVAPVANAAPLQQQPVKLEDRQVEDLAPNNKYLEWITNLKAKKHTLGASFNVHVFLGPIAEDNSALWHTAENHVGAFAALGQPSDTGCEKCQSDQANDVQVTAQIPLTIALIERYLAGQIDGLTPAVVEPYLQANLHWRVTLADGAEVPRGDVEDLVVSIVTNEGTIPESPDDLPIYAPLVELHPITTKADGATARGDGTGLTDRAQA